MNLGPSFPSRYADFDPFENVDKTAINAFLNSCIASFSHNVLPYLYASFNAIRCANLNDLVTSVQTRLCEDFGLQQVFPIRIRNFDHDDSSSQLIGYMSDRKVHPKARLAALELAWIGACQLANSPSFLHFFNTVEEQIFKHGLPLRFTDCGFEVTEDEFLTAQIIEPIWQKLADPEFASARQHLEEALDEHVRGDPEAFIKALKSFESVVKVVANQIGGIRPGTGAAYYLDQICSKGRISSWERDSMKLCFRDVRNPFSHGPGLEPIPQISRPESEFVIQFCIIAINRVLG